MTSKLLDVAGEGGIPIEEEEDYVAATDRGWRWKPKGLKQVLFESGWIDPDVPHGRYYEGQTRRFR